jgi:hypothetical protein
LLSSFQTIGRNCCHVMVTVHEKENRHAEQMQIVYKKAIKGYGDWVSSLRPARSRLRLCCLSYKLVGSLGRFYVSSHR